MASDNEGCTETVSQENESPEVEHGCCLNVGTNHRHEFVYILIFTGGATKIGRSADPHTRCHQHISATKVPLKEHCLFSVLDSVKAEQVLLNWYAKFNLNGEWFVLPEDEIQKLHDLKNEKVIINNTTFWVHDAHFPTCALCDALDDLEMSGDPAIWIYND